MDLIRADILVDGRVQGVGFRAFVRSKAKEFGVFGWVSNLEDKRVKAVLEGKREAVESLLHLIHEGPSGADVRQVEVSFENSPTGEFSSFEIVK